MLKFRSRPRDEMESIERTVSPAAETIGSAAPRGRVHAPLQVLGRALFGGYFLYNAVNHFGNHGMMTAYARSKQVPLPGLAVAATGGLLFVGGLSLLLGVRPRVGTSCITTFLLGVTPMMHDFWNVEDEQQRAAEMVNFSKNVALIGGASFAAAMPTPWPVSGDQAVGRFERRQRAVHNEPHAAAG